MNWLQKIASDLPPTSTSIGHGYRWNPETKRNVEEWQKWRLRTSHFMDI